MLNGASLRTPQGMSEEELAKLKSMVENKDGKEVEEKEDGDGKKKSPKDKQKKATANTSSKGQFEVESGEKVVKLSVHNEKVKKLETANKKLETKVEKLDKTAKETKAELTKLKKAYDSEKRKLEDTEAKLTDAAGRADRLDKELKDLKKKVQKNEEAVNSGKDSEIESLKKNLDKTKIKLQEANDKVKALETKSGEAASENDTLKAENAGLREDIEKLRKELDERPSLSMSGADAQSAESTVISRISPTEFQSPSFTGPRYRVSISRDCTFMTFKLDIMGSAICINGVISLPAVANYVPFNGKKDYTAAVINGEMRIVL